MKKIEITKEAIIALAEDNAIIMKWASPIMCEIIMGDFPDFTCKEIKKILIEHKKEVEELRRQDAEQEGIDIRRDWYEEEKKEIEENLNYKL